MEHKIIVIVEGGLIQEILDIPSNIAIEVHDYDCDEELGNGVEIDHDGNKYFKSTWR